MLFNMMSWKIDREIVFVWVLSAIVLLFSGGCGASAEGAKITWVTANVIPQQIPGNIDTNTPTTVLNRGDNGFWYAVGKLPAKATPGSYFMGVYGGDWPVADLERPMLAYGQVIERVGDDAAVVQIIYKMPSVELESLELSWDVAASGIPIGKGIGRVDASSNEENTLITLNIGEANGVRQGDVYAVLRPPQDVGVQNIQLSHQLVGLCLVRQITPKNSQCEKWQGHPQHHRRNKIAPNDQVVFLEHLIASRPPEAVIGVGVVEGDDDMQSKLIDQISNYMGQYPSSYTTVVAHDKAFDARDARFHRYRYDVDLESDVQLLVGASVHDVNGRAHLFVNYTGIGDAIGPGLIAASPEGGIDLGPVSQVSEREYKGFMAALMGAILAYRGQTSEGLMYLHEAISDVQIVGKARWHLRDQFAMRWGALGYNEEALWLVLQDEFIAAPNTRIQLPDALEQSDELMKKLVDQQAFLNALGTRVRLYDFMELPQQAFDSAQLYLKMNDDNEGSMAHLAALSMFMEMALRHDQETTARETLQQIRDYCPDTCDLDLALFLFAAYWSAYDDLDFRKEVVAEILQIAQQSDRKELIASARILQGMNSLHEGALEQALIAFYEAERLYTATNLTTRIARSKFYIFLTQLRRQEPQKAFDYANQALEIYERLGDFRAMKRIYESLGQVFSEGDYQRMPRTFVGAAKHILGGAVDVQIAAGDYAGAAEALLSLGGFFIRVGQWQDSEDLLKQAVAYGIKTVRFDLVALGHLHLAVVARYQGDLDVFQNEIQNAIQMAHLADDAMILEMIERFLTPPQDEEDEKAPTQLL